MVLTGIMTKRPEHEVQHESHFVSQRDPSRLDMFGRSMLHGKCYDRWFDKSFTLVVCANGRVSERLSHICPQVQAETTGFLSQSSMTFCRSFQIGFNGEHSW